MMGSAMTIKLHDTLKQFGEYLINWMQLVRVSNQNSWYCRFASSQGGVQIYNL